MKLSLLAKTPQLSILSKASALAALLLSNVVLAESYQSFSGLSYSTDERSSNMSALDFSSKSDTDTFALFSQFYFDERQALGPLNEFDYINTSSSIYAHAQKSSSEYSSDYKGHSGKLDTSNDAIMIGGEWISHNFILGAGYMHYQSKDDYSEYSSDASTSYYSASLGYLLSDDLVIRADYIDGGDGDDYFSYSASYNWQLAGTDYIGFSYNVDEDFDLHQLSSRYFMRLNEDSYLALGGNYTIMNGEYDYADDDWDIYASYYFNRQTSLSASYGDDDFYALGASYFINNNYSVQVGYNSHDSSKGEVESDGYYLNVTAQF